MSATPSVRAAFGWALLSLLGFGAALSLIVAGQSVGYQHYVPFGQLPTRPLAVGVVALQLLLVLGGMRSQLGAAYRAATSALPAWRIPVLLIVTLGSSAIVGRDLRRYGGEVVLSTFIQLLGMATTWLAVCALPADALQRFRAFAGRLLGDSEPFGDDVAPSLDRVAVVCAIGVTVVCALLAVFVYQRHPHLQDEVAYLFQARTIASGRLALPNPPVPKAFSLYLIATGPTGWFSPVPPGLALVFLPGVWLGIPWLVNPVLTGLNVLLVHLVLQPLYGGRIARLATVLFAFSPWNLFLGMAFMPHAITLFLALAATLAVITTRRTGAVRWMWLGGLALGFMATVRQLDAMVMAGALGLWCLGLGGRRVTLSATAALVLGSILGVAPLLPYNQHFTGKPTSFPIMAYNDAVFGKGSNDYGFGANRGMGWALDPNPGHGPVDGLINASLNTAASQVELFGWCIGSLLIVYAFVLRGRINRADRLMLAVIAFTWLAYFFNYFAGGPDFGARYWFLMIVPLVALTSRGALTLGGDEAARKDAQGADRAPLTVVQSRWLAAMALAVAGGTFVFMPWRMVDKYWHYRGVRPDLAQMADSAKIGDGLVMITGREYPDYAGGAMLNSLDLAERRTVYALRVSPSTDSATIAAFPDRAVWLVDGPTISRSGYVLRAGPLTAAEALARIAVPPIKPGPAVSQP